MLSCVVNAIRVVSPLYICRDEVVYTNRGRINQQGVESTRGQRNISNQPISCITWLLYYRRRLRFSLVASQTMDHETITQHVWNTIVHFQNNSWMNIQDAYYFYERICITCTLRTVSLVNYNIDDTTHNSWRWDTVIKKKHIFSNQS